MRASNDDSTEPLLAPYSQTPQIPHIVFSHGLRGFYLPGKLAWFARDFPAGGHRITQLAVIDRRRLVFQYRLNLKILKSHNKPTGSNPRAIHTHTKARRKMKPVV